MTTIPMLDPVAAAIVFGGTLTATVLRSGWREAETAVRAVARLFAPRFDAIRVRAELAQQAQEIDQDGLLRAAPHEFDDGEFNDLSAALVRHRSLQAVFEEHERHRGARTMAVATAARVLAQAAELGPVMGLAGTLASLAGRSPTAPDGNCANAIAMAVTSMFYGLVVANFVFAPLANAVERRSRREEAARQELLDWLAATLAHRCEDGPARAAA